MQLLTFMRMNGVLLHVPCRCRSYNIKIRSPDPPYLSLKPPIHVYQGLQLDVKGHDYAQLEKFTSYIHKFLNDAGYDVENFPLPPYKKLYRLYHNNSTNIRSEFEISEFRRIYRIAGVKAVHLPILLDLIYQNLSSGIKINVGKTDTSLDEDRFVPQLEKEALEKELSKLKV
ncbi:39S ribosomal protein L48 mitochondrial [Schistosoma japonicum]|nr:39S ribosomal protein L48 mitochondrial [Schistosoma japonicum]